MLLIINNNSYQKAVFFTSANRAVGGMMQTTADLEDYVTLKDDNDKLLAENATLRQQLLEYEKLSALLQEQLDTTFQFQKDSLYDTSNYRFIPANVINNSTLKAKNHITIDKGEQDGVKPGMGLITSQGVVGQVKATSNSFATCYSLLNTNLKVSAKLTKNDALCTVTWDGQNPAVGQVNYLARHIDVAVGDTVGVSGYNALYPPEVLIGTIKSVENLSSETFLKVEVELFEDFSKLSFVYVVSPLFKDEKDSLEQVSLKE
ncbi:rod shape-determining protein MreC [Algivirga pacifica]|uniref:Cell shape-determining protein MreC n=2 Tax=Algivirga pacifica TaxID=1162670 RepID=A0ABP9DAQ9_9BACT